MDADILAAVVMMAESTKAISPSIYPRTTDCADAVAESLIGRVVLACDTAFLSRS